MNVNDLVHLLRRADQRKLVQLKNNEIVIKNSLNILKKNCFLECPENTQRKNKKTQRSHSEQNQIRFQRMAAAPKVCYHYQHLNRCYCQNSCDCRPAEININEPNQIFLRATSPKNLNKYALADSSQQNKHSITTLFRTNKIFTDSPSEFDGFMKSQLPMPENSQLTYTKRRTQYENNKERNVHEVLQNKEFIPLSDRSPTKTAKVSFDYNIEDLDELKSFRLKNASDCVSILNQKINQRMMEHTKSRKNNHHICSHRYALDNKLHVKAIATDKKGNSLCSCCKKPTDCWSNDKISPVTVQNRFLTTNITHLNRDNLCSSQPVTVLEIPASVLTDTEQTSYRVKKSQSKNFKIKSSLLQLSFPPNSLALKYQPTNAKF